MYYASAVYVITQEINEITERRVHSLLVDTPIAKENAMYIARQLSDALREGDMLIKKVVILDRDIHKLMNM